MSNAEGECGMSVVELLMSKVKDVKRPSQGEVLINLIVAWKNIILARYYRTCC